MWIGNKLNMEFLNYELHVNLFDAMFVLNLYVDLPEAKFIFFRRLILIH